LFSESIHFYILTENKSMYEVEILEKFKNVPVFSLADASQLVKNRNYAKRVLASLLKKGKIRKIKRDLYTLHEDPFLVSNFIVRPSYISSISALYFYKDISQIPNEIHCFTNKTTKTFRFILPIKYFHTNFFFGFKEVEYENFKILIAEREKAIIDAIGKVPLYLIEEAVKNIDIEKMVSYVKKIGKSCIAKRVGYLLERNGKDVFNELKDLINKKFVYFDPITKGKRKNYKWWLVIW